MRVDLKMTPGKTAAQVGHAALGSYRTAMRTPDSPAYRNVIEWLKRGEPKVTLICYNEKMM